MDLSDYWKVAVNAFITLTGIALPLAIGVVKRLDKDYSSKNVTRIFWKTSIVHLVLWVIVTIIICANFLFPDTSFANCPYAFRATIICLLAVYFCFIIKIILFQENPSLVIKKSIRSHIRFIRKRDRYYHRRIKYFLQKRTIERWFSSMHNYVKKIFNKGSQKNVPLYPINIPADDFEELDNTITILSSPIEKTDRILLAITDVVCYAIRHKQYDVYSKGREHIKKYLRTVLESKKEDSHQINEQKIKEICEAVRTINATMCCEQEYIDTEMAANAVLMLNPFLIFFDEHETLCKTLWFMLLDMLKNNRTEVIELSENHLCYTINGKYSQYSKVWNILLIFNSLLLDQNKMNLVTALNKEGIGKLDVFNMDLERYLNHVLPKDEQLWWYRRQPWQTDDETELDLRNRLAKYYHFIKGLHTQPKQ